MEGLFNRLKSLSESDTYPFHMPGHKRNTQLLGNTLPYSIDVTEITGFDNLHEANGIIENVQQKLKSFYRALKSFLLVNGSTCGIMAGIISNCRFGGKIIASRNCHRSVYKAIELYGLKPVWIMPATDEKFGVMGEISAESVEAALCENTDVSLVVVTSPTYEGIISDIPRIAQVCHEHGAVLFADMAHGAHLPLFDGFDCAFGADIAVTSLHKTLPCLTQTACLNVYSERIDCGRLRAALSAFETSSPSYPLMASADLCMDLIKEKGNELKSEYLKRIDEFDKTASKLSVLKALCRGADSKQRFSGFDFGKIVISCNNSSMSGSELFAVLRDEFKLECEMAGADYIIAMTSICDTDEGFERLENAVLKIDSRLVKARSDVRFFCTEPKICLTAYEALRLSGQKVGLKNAVGRISREYIWTYPPGIPIVAPGEIITKEILKILDDYSKCGIEVHFENGTQEISVVKEQ